MFVFYGSFCNLISGTQQSYPAGKRDYFLVRLRTPAVIEICGNTHTVKENAFIIFTPHTPRTLTPVGTSYRFDYFHFDLKGECKDYLKHLSLPENTPFYVSDPDELSHRFLQALYERKADLPFSTELGDANVQWVLTRAAQTRLVDEGDFPENRYYHAIERQRLAVLHAPQKNWLASDAAAELGISVSHYHHIYRALFKTSFKEYVILARMRRAKELLRETDDAVLYVSEQCGYSDVFHFTKQFRAAVGTTPGQYRKAFRAKQK